MKKRRLKLFSIKLIFIVFGLTVSTIFLNPSRLSLKAAPQVTWPDLSIQAWVGNFQRPVGITHAGDNSGRVFVVEQPGSIRIIENRQMNPSPFLDIRERVKCCGEEGLLGLAFPPGFSEKGYFYVYYTRLDGNNQVSRFYLSQNGISADPESEAEILYLQHPSYSNHNGGQMAFGPDDYLYIGTGDGGGSEDLDGNAQNLASLSGKLLRIDVEKQSSGQIIGDLSLFIPLLSLGDDRPARAYSIPADNPFQDSDQARPEIWALGLRNPWRFSFDPLTGDLFIADVGQGLREEVDYQPASSTGGENYAWNILEGSLCYLPAAGCLPPADYVPPVAEYAHDLGCSVTGGEVYRGSEFPSLQGIYLYGDFCSGRIWGLVNDGSGWQNQELLDTSIQISTFGSDQEGNIYLADLRSGQLYRIAVNP